MGVPCMPVRPHCVVIAPDVHSGIGLTPVAVPAMAPITIWASAATTYYGLGDAPVPNVSICGENAVRKGSDSKYLRPHLSIINTVPPPPAVTVPPIADLGLFLVIIAVGCSKPVWGPTSVRAGGK